MKSEIIEKMSALITSAFGLVAALAWNSAIQSIFAKYYQQPGQDVPSQIVYAVVVTIIAVSVTIWMSRAVTKSKEREEQIRKHIEKLKKDIKLLKKRKK